MIKFNQLKIKSLIALFLLLCTIFCPVLTACSSCNHELEYVYGEEVTCTLDGFEHTACTCRKHTSTVIKQAKGHKDEDENSLCNVCEKELYKIDVEISANGNASAQVLPYVLVSFDERDYNTVGIVNGVIPIKLGDNSIVKSLTYNFISNLDGYPLDTYLYRPIENHFDLNLSIEAITDMLYLPISRVYGHYESEKQLMHRFDVKAVIIEVEDLTQSAVVMVTHYDEAYPTSLNDVQLYWVKINEYMIIEYDDFDSKYFDILYVEDKNGVKYEPDSETNAVRFMPTEQVTQLRLMRFTKFTE